MQKTLKALAVIAVIGGCTRTVYVYSSCVGAAVACACGNGLHGTETCENGKGTGQCVCVAPVTPTITITGSPAVLTSGATYTASVNAVDGLNYSWQISGGTPTTATNGTSFGFTAGNPGGSLLTANVTNSGGDTATPGELPLNIALAPEGLSAQDVFVPATLTQNRSQIPASVLKPVAGLTYLWSQSGGESIDASGTSVHLSTGSPGTMTVQIATQNAAGALSPPLSVTINVLPTGIDAISGVSGGPGTLDGQGGSARFSDILGITSDGAGTLYVSDRNNDTLRKIAVAGLTDLSTANVTTIAGSVGSVGFSTGQGTAALFSSASVAYGKAGLLAAQGDGTDAACPIESVSASGSVATISSTVANCTAAPGQNIRALAADAQGNGYFVDDASNLTQFAVNGGSAAQIIKTSDDLSSPTSVAATADGSILYVIDQNGIEVISKPTSGSTWSLKTVNSPCVSGSTNAIAVDSSSVVYVACGGSIWTSATKPVNTASFGTAPLAGPPSDVGTGSTFAPGPAPTDGVAAAATFYGPGSMVVDSGTLFVADGPSIRSVGLSQDQRGKVTTLFGKNQDNGHVDSTPAGAQPLFQTLGSLTIAPDDTIQVLESIAVLNADPNPSFRCDVREIDASGSVSTVTGSTCSGPINGSARSATLIYPVAMTRGPDGALYFSENDYQAYQDPANNLLTVAVEEVRELTPSGLLVTDSGALFDGPIDGNPNPQPIDGFDSSATFNQVGAITMNSDGSTLAVGDYIDEETGGLIRFVTAGQVVTAVGSLTETCFPEDTLDAAGCFGSVLGLAFAQSGTLYAAVNAITNANPSSLGPKIFSASAPDYIPQLIAGGADDCTIPKASEPCATACIRGAAAMAVQPVTGELYFADGELIRKVTTHADGQCYVDAVAGVPGEIGVRVGSMDVARLNSVGALAFSVITQDLYVTDSRENVVLRIRY